MWMLLKVVEKSINLRLIYKLDSFSLSGKKLSLSKRNKYVFFHNHSKVLIRCVLSACPKWMLKAFLSSTSG